MIVSGGENVYPPRLKTYCSPTTPSRRRPSSANPTREWGETVAAYVVAAGVDAAALDEFILE